MERHGLVRGRGVRAPPASGSRHPHPDHGCGRRRARVGAPQHRPNPRRRRVRRPPREVRPNAAGRTAGPVARRSGRRGDPPDGARPARARATRAADVAEVLDRTTTYLRNRLGRCPTPAEVARTGGLDVEDVLDEISRRRRTAGEHPPGGRLEHQPPHRRHARRRAGCRGYDRWCSPPCRRLPPPPPARPAPSCCARSRPGTAAAVGTAFLRSLVRHVAEALDAEIAFAAEVEEGAWARARVLAAHGRDGVELRRGLRFAIPGTPCELAADRDVVAIPTGTRGRVPARRLRRPPRARGLPGDRRPRRRRRPARLPRRDVLARARRGRGGDRGPAHLRLARRRRDRAPPPRGRAARPRARGRRLPRPAWSRSPTRSAARSAATSTTARSSG